MAPEAMEEVARELILFSAKNIGYGDIRDELEETDYLFDSNDILDIEEMIQDAKIIIKWGR